MDESQSKEELLKAFKPFDDFCHALIDSYALLGTDGKVVKCNQLFGVLTSMTTKQILKNAILDDLLILKIGGKNISVFDLLENDHPTRIDEVHGETSNQKNLNLIFGIYPFIVEGRKLGIFLLIRDVTAETNLQDQYTAKATQSITDKLTGLYNRQHFEQYLPSILNQMMGEGEDYAISLLMSDIDHFKKINDTHGHQAGDFILAAVAKLVKDTCRKTDVVCRYGGEEFLIILPGADLHDSVLVAEKLRVAIQDYKFVFNGTNIPVTLSLGTSQIRVGMEKADDAIARADLALYHSKEHGRNAVSTNEQGNIQMVKAGVHPLSKKASA